MSNNKTKKRRPFYTRKAFVTSVSIILGLLIILLIAFRVSPLPGAMVVRVVFDANAQSALRALQKHEPTGPVTVLSDQQYMMDNTEALLDVYIPDAQLRDGKHLPIVIWTHGGAWISGDKTNAAPYYAILADRGFIVVSVNYSLAPGKAYPTQIHQLNAAHAYIQANADRFKGDAGKMVLAGDSAGAQLSSQMAAIITNSQYADELGITPSLDASDLAGVALFCGIYKMEELTHPNTTTSKIVSWGSDVTVWSYTGTRDVKSPLLRQMSAYYHVDRNFPKTFISGGNNDPLTDVQSVPMAAKLQSLGVNVTTLFYASDHQPGLPHEYQFNLDNDDGINALAQLQAFLESVGN